MNAYGSQLNLMFHIDDALLGHVKSNTVTECIKKLDRVHGLIELFTVTRLKHHTLLGKTIYFGIVDKSCVITQHNFIKKMCQNLPNELKVPHSNTPARKGLFKISPSAEILSKPKS